MRLWMAQLLVVASAVVLMGARPPQEKISKADAAQRAQRAKAGGPALPDRAPLITIDARKASVRDVLQTIADFGGLALVVAEDVKGRMDLKLRSVPWKDAFDAVVRSQGLGQVRQGEIVFVDRIDRLLAYEETRLARKRATLAQAPLVTRVIRLSYARAANLAPVVRGLLTERGSVVVDVRTNTLIVTDVAATMDAIAEAGPAR